MSIESIFVGENAKSVVNSPLTRPYTRVILKRDGETVFKRGDDSGKTLYLENPYATQAMCDNIFAQVAGYRYQPVTVKDALINPAAEIGDAITSIGGYSGIYSQTITFGDRMTRSISSADDEDTESEYQYNGKQQFATYEGLLKGTTKVNGAGLTRGSVGGGAIKSGSISGGSLGHIKASTITTGETSPGINETLKAADNLVLTIDAWVNGSGASFSWVDTEGIRIGTSRTSFFGDLPIYVDSKNYLRAGSAPD